KHINADRRLKLMPSAESGVRVVVANASDASDTTSSTTDRAEEKQMIDKPNDRLALEATIEALREQRAQMKTLTDACADMGHATPSSCAGPPQRDSRRRPRSRPNHRPQ